MCDPPICEGGESREEYACKLNFGPPQFLDPKDARKKDAIDSFRKLKSCHARF